MIPVRLYLMGFALLLITGCAGPVRAPFEVPPEERALAAAPAGPLASLEQAIKTRVNVEQPSDSASAQHSGFKLLNRSEDALRWRLALIDSATQSIDTQYYLYHGDSTGLLFTNRLLAAADRGVRVRIIIDDMGTLALSSSQTKLRNSMGALMIAHPNISLRLFNSGENRSALGRGWDFATDFEQLNRRMHNKSLTIDNRATIIGGRNIGDEYMGLNSHFNFRDIDVMGIGHVARQTSEVFDLFWNSGWVIHANQATRDKAAAVAPNQRVAMDRELRRSEELERFSLTPRSWASELSALLPTLHLGSSEVLTDRPGPDDISNDIYEWITGAIPRVKKELLVTNAYLIPDTPGVDMLENLAQKGVDIQIHTNSLASQDVPAVNSHYKSWRRPILQTGASLYEARQDAAIKMSVVDTLPISAKYMGLHSKSMVIDRRFAVIGSANLDPRSAFLNSEMIVVVDSEGLAEELAQAVLRDVDPANSWEVKLNDAGELLWQNDVESTQRQPTRSSFQQIEDWFFMLFPKRLY